MGLRGWQDTDDEGLVIIAKSLDFIKKKEGFDCKALVMLNYLPLHGKFLQNLVLQTLTFS